MKMIALTLAVLFGTASIAPLAWAGDRDVGQNGNGDNVGGGPGNSGAGDKNGANEKGGGGQPG